MQEQVPPTLIPGFRCRAPHPGYRRFRPPRREPSCRLGDIRRQVFSKRPPRNLKGDHVRHCNSTRALGVGMDESSRPDLGPSIVVSNVREDIVSITNLLLMAQASAKVHCPDRECISLMEQCIARLLERYGLSRAKLGDGLRIKEFIEIPALVRVLRYARAEALQSFDDTGCADLLGECIDRLTKTHELSQVLYPPAVALN
jgi:hypothetical protein